MPGKVARHGRQLPVDRRSSPGPVHRRRQPQEAHADELDAWLDDRAEELSTRTLRLVYQILERAIRHAQARGKVRRNVASLVILPVGQEGPRPGP